MSDGGEDNAIERCAELMDGWERSNPRERYWILDRVGRELVGHGIGPTWLNIKSLPASLAGRYDDYDMRVDMPPELLENRGLEAPDPREALVTYLHEGRHAEQGNERAALKSAMAHTVDPARVDGLNTTYVQPPKELETLADQEQQNAYLANFDERDAELYGQHMADRILRARDILRGLTNMSPQVDSPVTRGKNNDAQYGLGFRQEPQINSLQANQDSYRSSISSPSSLATLRSADNSSLGHERTKSDPSPASQEPSSQKSVTIDQPRTKAGTNPPPLTSQSQANARNPRTEQSRTKSGLRPPPASRAAASHEPTQIERPKSKSGLRFPPLSQSPPNQGASHIEQPRSKAGLRPPPPAQPVSAESRAHAEPQKTKSGLRPPPASRAAASHEPMQTERPRSKSGLRPPPPSQSPPPPVQSVSAQARAAADRPKTKSGLRPPPPPPPPPPTADRTRGRGR